MPRRFALACATISLLVQRPAAAQPAAKTAALVLLDSGDRAPWESAAQAAGWRVIVPAFAADANIDARVQAAQKAVAEAVQNGSADPARVYLAGRGEASAAVFYTIARVPDLWAAAVALGGSPEPAIDSGRLFAANFSEVPLLWIGPGAEAEAIAGKLASAGISIERRDAASTNPAALLEWLSQHKRAEFPLHIDCETDSPTFSGCYWIRMTKFDAAERNDVLDSTRVAPARNAALDLGGFGFKPDDPGPGILVTYLPEKYGGPLKMGDRIVALDGREIANARRYLELMAQISEDRPATAMVQRGKERIRLETQIVLPRRPAATTARVQAQFMPGENEVEILSRSVTEMRVTIPADWVPARLSWNGVPLEQVDAPGCRLLSIDKALQKAGACP